ncbi:hypothetical protein SDC9_96655 [bioreactor metagenome]|uniref:Uncharacterized protein n=1 Tax=bioreactor metagenome TaxID=1076179 RepID=A0A645ACC3_9ZZZZ
MEFHALAQVEHIGRFIGGFPAFGQLAADGHIGVEADKLLIHLMNDAQRGFLRVRMGIKAGGLGVRTEAEGSAGGGRSRGRGRRGGGGGRRGRSAGGEHTRQQHTGEQEGQPLFRFHE